MERIDNLGLAGSGEVAVIEQQLERTVDAARWKGWAATGVLVLAGAGLLWAAGMRFWQRLDQMEQAEAARTDALAARLTDLSKANDGLKQEVIDLRTALATATGEDVLFLKTIILKPNLEPDLARTVARLVHKYSARYNKDPNLVLAIISVESDFNPQAVSKAGALGLMQVMPHWKKILAIEDDLTDPETSIRYGLQVLGFYEQMYKDPETVLTAYNRGPGPVDLALVKGANPDNGYSGKVLAAYEKIRRLATRASLN
jgi:soluble lytic murein transglycosylase-like protein